MSTINTDIVAKLWNLCNILKDDGVTYHQYVIELTYLLFLKMAKETSTEDAIPTGHRWDDLEARAAPDQLEAYKLTLSHLGSHGSRLVQEIFANASSFIKNRIRSPRWWLRSTSLTGTARGKKGLAISTKGYWRRTPTRRNPALANTSHPGR